MFCIYFTFYLGDKLPPFYLGSTKVIKIDKGYHGSATSAKWGSIWKEELKNNSHLFKTFIIPNQYKETAQEIVELELLWQKAFKAVENPLFINQSYARGGFCTTAESSAKAEETKVRLGKTTHSETTKKKIGDANRGRVLPPVSDDTRDKLSKALKGRILTQEHKDRIAETNTGKIVSDDTKAKLSIAHTGKILSEEHKAKIIGTGRTHTQSAKDAIGNANRGRILPPKPPMSESTKTLLRKANIGKTWSDEKRAAIKATKDRKRLEREQAKLNVA